MGRDVPQALAHVRGPGRGGGCGVIGHGRDPPLDVGRRADEQQRPAERDHVAVTNDPDLDFLAVDLRAVGALEVRGHDLLVVGLEFQMVSADAVVVELDRVSLLAADRDGCGQVVEDPASIGAVEHSERDERHPVGIR